MPLQQDMRTQDQIDLEVLNNQLALEDHELSKKREEIEGLDPESDDFFYINNEIIFMEINIIQLQNDIQDIWQLYVTVE